MLAATATAGGALQLYQQQVTVMAVATADALMTVEVTVAAMMENRAGMATMTSDSGVMGDNNRLQQQ